MDDIIKALDEKIEELSGVEAYFLSQYSTPPTQTERERVAWADKNLVLLERARVAILDRDVTIVGLRTMLGFTENGTEA